MKKLPETLINIFKNDTLFQPGMGDYIAEQFKLNDIDINERINFESVLKITGMISVITSDKEEFGHPSLSPFNGTLLEALVMSNINKGEDFWSENNKIYNLLNELKNSGLNINSAQTYSVSKGEPDREPFWFSFIPRKNGVLETFIKLGVNVNEVVYDNEMFSKLEVNMRMGRDVTTSCFSLILICPIKNIKLLLEKGANPYNACDSDMFGNPYNCWSMLNNRYCSTFLKMTEKEKEKTRNIFYTLKDSVKDYNAYTAMYDGKGHANYITYKEMYENICPEVISEMEKMKLKEILTPMPTIKRKRF